MSLERPGGLVGENDVWRAYYGASDGQSLLLSARQFQGRPTSQSGGVHPAQRGRGFKPGLPPTISAIKQGQRDVVQRVNPRQQIVGLKDETNAAVPYQREFVGVKRGYILARQVIGTFVGPIKAPDYIQQGCLAGTGRAGHRSELAAWQGEADIVQRMHGLVPCQVAPAHVTKLK